MSFQTEMEARFGSQLLVRYTNPDSKSASSIGTTILAAALVFAQGRFRTYAGVAYDDTDSRMIDCACDLAIYQLAGRFAERGEYQRQYKEAVEYLKDLRKVTNANRIIPAKKQINSYPNTNPEETFADNRRLGALGFPTLNQAPSWTENPRP